MALDGALVPSAFIFASAGVTPYNLKNLPNKHFTCVRFSFIQKSYFSGGAMGRQTVVLNLILVTLFLLGCSGQTGNPLIPGVEGDTQDRPAGYSERSGNSNPFLWGYYDLIPDLDSGSGLSG